MNKEIKIHVHIMCLLLAAIPVSLGLISFFNNIQTYQMTMTKVVYPLITMEQINPGLHTFRAINNSVVAHTMFIVMTLTELAISVISLIGCCQMFSPNKPIENSIWIIQFACIWGVFVWGFGFFTAADFFLAWQTNTLKFIQPASLQYAGLMFMVLYCLELLKKHHN